MRHTCIHATYMRHARLFNLAENSSLRLDGARHNEKAWLQATKALEKTVDALQERLLAANNALKMLEDKVYTRWMGSTSLAVLRCCAAQRLETWSPSPLVPNYRKGLGSINWTVLTVSRVRCCYCLYLSARLCTNFDAAVHSRNACAAVTLESGNSGERLVYRSITNRFLCHHCIASRPLDI